MSYLRKKKNDDTSVKAVQIIHRCGGCRKKQTFINTGRFRVNANGSKLDVWLIYQCEKCKHTMNIPIYERVNPTRISREEYERFLENDRELAGEYGGDVAFFKSRHYEIKK